MRLHPWTLGALRPHQQRQRAPFILRPPPRIFKNLSHPLALKRTLPLMHSLPQPHSTHADHLSYSSTRRVCLWGVRRRCIGWRLVGRTRSFPCVVTFVCICILFFLCVALMLSRRLLTGTFAHSWVMTAIRVSPCVILPCVLAVSPTPSREQNLPPDAVTVPLTVAYYRT